MTDENILIELQKINKKLEVISNPLKNAGYSFSTGIFRSLGNLFGTFIIAAFIVYLFTQLNLTEKIDSYIKNLIPSTQFNIVNPFSLPSPDQL